MSAIGRNLIVTGKLTGQPVIARVDKWQQLLILAIITAITGCEYLFVYKDVAYAIGLALFLALGIYATISIVRLNQPITACAGSLALIPLYVLFTSSLPWFFVNQQYLASEKKHSSATRCWVWLSAPYWGQGNTLCSTQLLPSPLLR